MTQCRINSKKLVENYIYDRDWRTKENSNSPKSFGGLNKYIAGEVSKDYWLNSVYTEEIKQAYLDGDLHIHDLSGLTLYCCGFSLENILLMGVQGVSNLPTSAPASHFDSALSQIANIVTVYQNEIMGAVALNSVDTMLAPFIKKDGLTKKQVKQSLQNFIFAINSNSRGGAEPAFTNITLDVTPPDDMLTKNIIISGNFQTETYSDFQTEMDMFNDVFADLMIGGDSLGKPFAYPIITYNINKRFDWDNPNTDKIFEMAGKFGYPYFSNYVNSDMDTSDIRSMCPLTSDTTVLVKTKQNGVTIREIGDIYATSTKGTDYEVWSDDGFVKGKPIQVPMTDVYEITLSNGTVLKLGENHLQPIFGNKTLTAKELKIGMWLPTNKSPIINGVGNYDLGYSVGAYIGDGSKDDSAIIYSLCKFEKDDETEQRIVRFWNSIGYKTTTTMCDRNVRSIRVNGYPYSIIKEYVYGDNAITKGLTNKVYDMSIEFRKGLVDGFKATDGSREKNRLYTSSNILREDMMQLFATLGEKCIINYSDTRDGRLGTKPNYRIDFPKRENYGELFKSDNDFNYYKITKISNIGKQLGYLYCFEVDSTNNLFMLGNGVITHNCRLRLDLTELRSKNGGLFGSGDSTGSVGVVTINLPRIGYLSNTKAEFYDRLDRVLDIAYDSLELKRIYLEDVILQQGLLPAYMTYVGTLNNHFSTIGDIGKNEMCENFLGKGHGILSEDGKAFALEVGEYFRHKLQEYQVKSGNLYNYEATPAESTCYRLAKKDTELYPDIITQGNIDSPYYTNSCHIPVSQIENLLQIYNNQDELQCQYTGGTVVHNYLNGAISGEKAKHIVKTILTNFKLPYISLSPLNRYCPEHGYVEDHVDVCPICGKELDMYQRITGYLRPVSRFNAGKTQEFIERKQLDGNTL